MSHLCRLLLLLASVSTVISQAAGADDGERRPPRCSSRGSNLIQLNSTRDHRRHPKVEDDKVTHPTICALRDGQCFDLTLKAVGGLKNCESVELVVARHGEDIRWLDALPEFPTVVYNRGGPSDILPKSRANLKVVRQNNTGREDEVFLRHIIDRYDKHLPETTVFLQGWPFLHCPGMVDTLRKTLASTCVSGLSDELGLIDDDSGIAQGAPGLMPISRTFYEYNVEKGRMGEEIAWAKYLEGDAEAARARALFVETCELIMGGPCPTKQFVAEGAQWAVSRKRIRAWPIKLYLRALQVGEGYHAKLRGLVLEALWPALWGARHGEWAPKALLLESRAWQDTHSPVNGHASAPSHHCDARDGSRSLLWSCEDRMGHCELQMHDKKHISSDFLKQRHRYQFSGTFHGNHGWTMHAKLRAPGLPGPHRLIAVDLLGTGVQLRLATEVDEEDTHWKVLDHRKSSDSEARLIIGQIGAEGQYMGCDVHTGRITVSSKPTAWVQMRRPDGCLALAYKDRVLHFQPFTGRVSCVPERHHDHWNRETSLMLVALSKEEIV